MKSVASVTMWSTFFNSTPPTFLAMELTLVEYYYWDQQREAH
jgi:hypothetical protein